MTGRLSNENLRRLWELTAQSSPANVQPTQTESRTIPDLRGSYSGDNLPTHQGPWPASWGLPIERLSTDAKKLLYHPKEMGIPPEFQWKPSRLKEHLPPQDKWVKVEGSDSEPLMQLVDSKEEGVPGFIPTQHYNIIYGQNEPAKRLREPPQGRPVPAYFGLSPAARDMIENGGGWNLLKNEIPKKTQWKKRGDEYVFTGARQGVKSPLSEQEFRILYGEEEHTRDLQQHVDKAREQQRTNPPTSGPSGTSNPKPDEYENAEVIVKDLMAKAEGILKDVQRLPQSAWVKALGQIIFAFDGVLSLHKHRLVFGPE